jgi:hypothetical protein
MTTQTLPRPCAIPPADKQRQAKRVGDDLIRHHGKRRFYSVSEIRAANQRCDIPIDFCCWSYAMYGTHFDFDRMHEAAGEACDYLAMKAEMLDSVARHASTGWFDFDLSWIDFPDLDWSVFDLFD